MTMKDTLIQNAIGIAAAKARAETLAEVRKVVETDLNDVRGKPQWQGESWAYQCVLAKLKEMGK